MNGDRPDEPEDLPVPPRLVEALAALHPERVFVPPQVDEAILEQAREHLGTARPSTNHADRDRSPVAAPPKGGCPPHVRAAPALDPAATGDRSRSIPEWAPPERSFADRGGCERRRARRRALAPWLAAAASFALGAWVAQTLLHHKPGDPASLAREDVNGDGRVDILDALALSRQIDRGTAGRFDLNGDGRVDQQDVHAVAAHAVRLESGS